MGLLDVIMVVSQGVSDGHHVGGGSFVQHVLGDGVAQLFVGTIGLVSGVNQGQDDGKYSMF